MLFQWRFKLDANRMAVSSARHVFWKMLKSIFYFYFIFFLVGM